METKPVKANRTMLDIWRKERAESPRKMIEYNGNGVKERCL